jgi:hypothetical protein
LGGGDEKIATNTLDVTSRSWQGGDEGVDTLETIEVLDRAMARPVCCICTSTLVEMGPHPERALPAADHLRDLVSDAGHLL